MEGVKKLSKIMLEKKAIEILTKYDCKYLIPEDRENLYCVNKILDIENLIEEHFDLSLDYKSLSKDGSVLGITSFGKSLFPVISDNEKVEMIKINVGDILIDTGLIDEGNEGRIRFTMAHELSHWILHRELFIEGYTKREKNIIISEDTKEGLLTLETQYKTDEEWIEWQADYLAGALLMPATLFVYYFNIIRKKLDINQSYLYLDNQKCNIQNYFYTINILSKIFGVSRLATKVRLCKLGLLKEEIKT